MKYLLLNLLCINLFIVTIFASHYNRYVLYKIEPTTDTHINMLRGLRDSTTHYHFWKFALIPGNSFNILCPPTKTTTLEIFLNKYKIRHFKAITNVAEAIAEQNITEYVYKSGVMESNGYYSLKDIYNFMHDLTDLHPNHASIVRGGESTDGRDIKGLNISFGKAKSCIFVEGGIHGREWLSPATVVYIMRKVLQNTNRQIRDIIESYDWYLFPIVNPDGYVHTFEKDRFWLKNTKHEQGFFGVNLNRNWNIDWMPSKKSTLHLHSDNFPGRTPFSEAETKTLSRFIEKIAPKMTMYISFHSYGQKILLPYHFSKEPAVAFGMSHDAYSEDYEKQFVKAKRAANALKNAYGTEYKIGQASHLEGEYSGTSTDWVKRVLKIPYVYTYMLRDDGNFGYLVPASKIRANNEEVWESLLHLIQPDGIEYRRLFEENPACSCKISFIALLCNIVIVLLSNMIVTH